MDMVSRINGLVRVLGSVNRYNEAQKCAEAVNDYADVFVALGITASVESVKVNRLTIIRQAATEAVRLRGLKATGTVAPKNQKSEGSGDYIASVLTPKGEVDTTIDFDYDAEGNRVQRNGTLRKAFTSYTEAQNWLFRKLAMEAGPGCTGEIKCSSAPNMSGTFTREQAERVIFAKRSGPAMHVSKGGKVNADGSFAPREGKTTLAKFSRA